MLVFLSWSGDRSRAVADVLKTWLAQTIQSAQPWLSADIEKGSRWGVEIAAKLELSTVGIVCLTRDNLDSRWLLFEAGALSKAAGTYACTFLLDVTPADVEPPLSQFQHTLRTKPDVRRLVETINAVAARAGERALDPMTLRGAFETFWPQLDQQLQEIADLPASLHKGPRPPVELLNEILTIARAVERRQITIERRSKGGEAESILAAIRKRAPEAEKEFEALLQNIAVLSSEAISEIHSFTAFKRRQEEFDWEDDTRGEA